MKDLTITLKNCPPEIAAMIEAAFVDVPKQLDRPTMEMPADGLSIDFDQVDEHDMQGDLITSAHVFIMAYGWLAYKKQDNEGQ